MRESSPAPSRPERMSVPVGEARDIILASLRPLGPETVGLRDAVGRVTCEEIRSNRTIPPNDNSAMDGYAVRAEDTAKVPSVLKVVETLPAGSISSHLLGPGEAARIFTGAPIPPGSDAVVMQEHTQAEGAEVHVLRAAALGDHIRKAGSDVTPDTLIAPEGTRLRPSHVGMLAALGRTQIQVVRRPRVAILATGDELVEPDRLCDDGQIATSNSYGLQACLQEIDAEPVYIGIIPDDRQKIHQAFSEAMRCDAVISTGGVSVGDFDWIKEVLADLGGALHLFRVRMKPGAPLAFLMAGDVPVFGLPGNPVSTLVSFEQFVRPALLRMMRRTNVFRPVVRAVMAEDYHKPEGRAHFVRVLLHERDGRRFALVSGDQSSGVLLSMVRAHGLAIIPAETTHVKAGEPVQVQLIQADELRRTPGF